eukprot:1396124-Ditylum_brightwellii.AAC.1
MDSSPKHVEFISLCKRKQWDNMPVLGGDEDLDDFRRQGLNGDGVIEFTRTQLMAKFQKWKSSGFLAAAESEERLIDDRQTKSTVNNLAVVRSGSFYRYVMKNTLHEDLLNQQQVTKLLDELQISTIILANGALSCQDLHNIEESSKIYFAMKKKNVGIFISKWASFYEENHLQLARQVQSIAILISIEFLDKLNHPIKHCGDVNFADLVKQILMEQYLDYPVDTARKEVFYYVVGWRL